MITGIFVAMAAATVLWLFDLDDVLTIAINEVLGTSYSTNVYWLFFFVSGALIGIVHEFTK